MMLFTDGTISTLLDLQAYESSIFNTAGAEGVDLAGKLALAQQEIGIELEAFLARQGTAGRGLDLGHVAVTQAMRYWHAMRSVALFYQDVYNNQLNDRYLGKWKEYRRLAGWALELLLETGVGIVNAPIPRPCKVTASSVPGSLPGSAYYLQATWVDAAGAESAASETVLHATEDGSALAVDVRGAPANASGWNVYAGTAADEVTRQNAEMLAIGAQWVMPATGLLAGSPPGGGQFPDQLMSQSRILQRG